MLEVFHSYFYWSLSYAGFDSTSCRLVISLSLGTSQVHFDRIKSPLLLIKTPSDMIFSPFSLPLEPFRGPQSTCSLLDSTRSRADLQTWLVPLWKLYLTTSAQCCVPTLNQFTMGCGLTRWRMIVFMVGLSKVPYWPIENHHIIRPISPSSGFLWL